MHGDTEERSASVTISMPHILAIAGARGEPEVTCPQLTSDFAGGHDRLETTDSFVVDIRAVKVEDSNSS